MRCFLSGTQVNIKQEVSPILQKYFEKITHAILSSDSEMMKVGLLCFFLFYNLSHIQQICSRQLWKCHLKIMENLSNCSYNYRKKLITMWQKEILIILSNFSFCHDVFKSCILQKCQNVSIGRKGLNTNELNLTRSFIVCLHV